MFGFFENIKKDIMRLFGKIIIDRPVTIEVFPNTTTFHFDDGKKEEYSIKDVFNVVPSREKALCKFKEGKYEKIVFFNNPEVKLLMKSNYSLMNFYNSNSYQITSIVYDDSLNEKNPNPYCNIVSFEQPLRNLELSTNVRNVNRMVVQKTTIENLKLSINKSNVSLYDDFFNVFSSSRNKQYQTITLDLYTPVNIYNTLNVKTEILKINIQHSTLSNSLEKTIKLISRLSMGRSIDEKMSIHVHFAVNEINYYGKAKFESDFKKELSRIGNNISFKLLGEEKTEISIENGKINKYVVEEMFTSPRKLKYRDGLVVGYEDE